MVRAKATGLSLLEEKTVFILCNIPLDIPIDRLVTWRQLAGDNRVGGRARSLRGEKLGGAPLGRSEAQRAVPGAVAHARAAEGWLRNNPLDPSYLLLGFGVFLWTTNPSGSGAGAGRGHWCGTGPMRGQRVPVKLGRSAILILSERT